MTPRIFLVDDEHTVTMPLYKSALERRHLDVVQYISTDDAVRAFDREEPTLVVLDLLMDAGKVFAGRVVQGQADAGLLLYKELRKRYPRTPVIVLTDYRESARKQFAFEPSLRVIEKAEYPPSKFADVVLDTLEQSGVHFSRSA